MKTKKIFGVSKANIFLLNINLTTLAQPSDIIQADGEENMGGFGMVGYLALRSHIDSYPTEGAQTDLDSLVKLDGNYAMKTDRKFMTLEFVPETIKLTPESQGEHVGGQSFKIKGEAFIAGTKAVQRGFARLLNNSYGILILNQDDGTRLNLGTYQRPVKFKVSTDEGQKAADKKGISITFESDSFVPGYQYDGTIILSAETLPAVS